MAVDLHCNTGFILLVHCVHAYAPFTKKFFLLSSSFVAKGCSLLASFRCAIHNCCRVFRVLSSLLFPIALCLCIRCSCSSIQLLGDLLYRVSGLSGKMSTESEEDDNFGTEEARTAIIRCLGEERRNHVLAGLYMGRWVWPTGCGLALSIYSCWNIFKTSMYVCYKMHIIMRRIVSVFFLTSFPSPLSTGQMCL